MTTGRLGATWTASEVAARLAFELEPVRIACVSTDAGLLAALRAAAPATPVLPVTSPAALVDVLLTTRCGVLAIEIAELGATAITVLGHLGAQFPDLPIIGIGDRHDEVAVSHLISTGEVYRFLHRPVSTPRARTFIEAALRRHQELRDGTHAERPDPYERASAAAPGRSQARAPRPAAKAPPQAWTGPRSGLAIGAGIGLLALAALAIGLAPSSPRDPAEAAPRPALLRRAAQAPAPDPAAAEVEGPAAAPAIPAAPPATTAREALADPTAESVAQDSDEAEPVVAARPAAARSRSARHPPAPVRIHYARPSYPDAARDVGLEGWVDVRFTVNAAGEPENLRVRHADPTEVFEDAALEAVRRWRYAPPAAPVRVDARVQFRLHAGHMAASARPR